MCLNLEKCWIDVTAVLALIDEPPDSSRHDLLKNTHGILLEDLTGVSNSCDEWLATERSYIEDKIRRVHERRLARLAEQNSVPQVRIQAARDLIEFDSTHERGWQILIKALVEAGDRTQAIREYNRCREILGRVLQVAPSVEMQSLNDSVRVAARGATVAFPSSASHGTGPSNVGKTRLRVAVLPFSGTGFTPDMFRPSSLALDTAAALARFRWFDVIAPMALPSFADDDPSSPTQLRELDVDYAVTGMLRAAGSKIKIKIMLLDVSAYTRPVWNENYELPRDALGEADEHIVTKIVARIDPIILFIEGTRFKDRESSDATRLVLRAIPLLYSLRREAYLEAGAMLTRAVSEAPNHSMAAAWLAFWHLFNVGQGWSTDPAEEYLEVERLSQRAIELDPDNSAALGMYAHSCSYIYHDFDAATHFFDRSLLLNPNLAFIWALSAPTSCYMGMPNDALERLRRYRELAPFDPYFRLFETIYTVSYTFAGEYEKAVIVGRRSVRANPDFTNGYKPLLSALGHLGLKDEATHFLKELLLREPSFCVESFSKRYPFRRGEDRERYVEGLRKAGVPERR